MNNPFVIPLGIAFIAGTIATFVSLVRRVTNYSADEKRATEHGRISRQEWRRNSVLYITCGVIVFLALLNLSITYVKAFRHHAERADGREAVQQTSGLRRTSVASTSSGSRVQQSPAEKISTSTRASWPVASTIRRMTPMSITPSPIMPRSVSSSFVGTEPVAELETEQALEPGALDLARQVRGPSDVMDIERDTASLAERVEGGKAAWPGNIW